MRVEKFKYLDEWIEPNVCEKEDVSSKLDKMKIPDKLNKDVYKKRSTCLNVSLRYYCIVLRPEALFSAECPTMNRNRLIEKLGAKERRILRKIFGSIKENGEYRRRYNHELCTHVENIMDPVR